MSSRNVNQCFVYKNKKVMVTPLNVQMTYCVAHCANVKYTYELMKTRLMNRHQRAEHAWTRAKCLAFTHLRHYNKLLATTIIKLFFSKTLYFQMYFSFYPLTLRTKDTEGRHREREKPHF